ncbi:inositol polyphosphate multikinase [Flagelloscypha sp. PMI_526]|nr:inositol polyphosphate multikinase [Flagelloscypha sp. PMI_526]
MIYDPPSPPPSMTSPNPVTFQALATQVGGSPGVQNGSLFVKPALPLEIEFYQTLNAAPGEDNPFSTLKQYMPKFVGTLKFQGPVGVDCLVNALDHKGKRKESLVLENLCRTFTKPNILDIKLGTEHYDHEASPQKRERRIKTAHETTSFESGLRLAEFQIYSNETGLPIQTPKSYGKSIKVPDLPNSIRKLFPTSSDPSVGSGLPPRVLLPILKHICAEIKEILTAFEKIEARVVGGSLLIIYEADLAQAEDGVNSFYSECTPSEIVADDEKKYSPLCQVKMIDFAHTRLVPGQGEDKGVVKGFNSILSLIAGRIEELQKEFD